MEKQIKQVTLTRQWSTDSCVQCGGGLVLVGCIVLRVVFLWRKRQRQSSKPTIEHHGRTPGSLSRDLAYDGRHGMTRNTRYDGHVDRLDQGYHGPQQRQHHRSGQRYTSDKEDQWSQRRHVYSSHDHYPAQQHHNCDEGSFVQVPVVILLSCLPTLQPQLQPSRLSVLWWPSFQTR